MFQVKILNKKAKASESLVECVEFATREDAVAYVTPYWIDNTDYQGIIEDYSQVS